jgi:CDP-4-dehydro-6-deoxyglucose reductase, E3
MASAEETAVVNDRSITVHSQRVPDCLRRCIGRFLMSKVTIESSGHTFECGPEENVLAAGLRAGFMLPYNCRSGLCRTCKSRVVSGAVQYRDKVQTHYLSTEDQQKGFALLCQAQPCSDLVIQTDEIVGMENLRPRVTPCRITEMTLKSSDIMVLRLRLPMNENVAFFSGQHLSFILKDGARREYSIANACGPAGMTAIELHIRRYPGGDFTDRLFTEISVGALMRIELPLGTFFLRTDETRPLVLMATGTGFAPIKAMLEQAVATGLIADRELTLYWGGRRREDLYMFELAEAWAQEYPRFRFVPILSRPEPGWTGRTGYVQHNVLSDYTNLSNYDVYACGSPAMVQSARTALTSLDAAAPARFFGDEFLTSADKAETHDEMQQ